MPDFTDRPIAIVRDNLGEQRDTARTITLVKDFFELPTLQLAGTFHDGAFDVVRGHVERLGVEDGLAEPWVTFGVSSADPCSDCDFLDELGESAAALGIDGALSCA